MRPEHRQHSETVVIEPTGRGVLDAPPSRGTTAEMLANMPHRYSRNAGLRICIDLLSILSIEHAEVVTATAANGDNS